MTKKSKISSRKDFLKKHILTEFSSKQLPNDASLRIYERIKTDKKTFIFMDASKDLESVAPFIQIGNFLTKNKYSAPQILATDEVSGFILLEDLGNLTYSNKLKENIGENVEHELYKKAIDVLIDLHKLKEKPKLQEYSSKLLIDESLFFTDYYLKILNGCELHKELREEYIEAWNKVLTRICYKSSCLVLRDYHVDNLMYLEDRSGIQTVGILDFQDAILGSYAYDLVSLFEDARRDVSENIVSQMIAYYLDNMPSVDHKKFFTDYTILAVQRSCKIVGIFSRKAIVDNDSRYIKHLPRTLAYIKKYLNNPILEPIKNWFNKIDIPALRDNASN